MTSDDARIRRSNELLGGFLNRIVDLEENEAAAATAAADYDDDFESNSSRRRQPDDHIQDLLKIIQMQQSRINQLNLELNKRNQMIPRDLYEKVLNQLEDEKYEHSRTKSELEQTKEKLDSQIKECDYLRSDLEKERKIYGNTFELLKDKALNERTKSIDLVSKYAEAQIKFNNALEDVVKNEKKYTKLYDEIKQKEQTYEHKMDEMVLKIEQEKYINQLLTSNNQHEQQK